MEERDLLPGEHAALGLLTLDPAHGYELHRRWAASALFEVLPLEQSVLYSYLRTLDRRGLLDWEEHRVGNRPPRKIYRPSELGEAFLRPWLRSPVYHLRDVRLDFLLKLHLLSQIDPRSEAILVERQIVICEGILRDASEAARAIDDPSEFIVLFQQSRASAATAALGWLRAYHDRVTTKAKVS